MCSQAFRIATLFTLAAAASWPWMARRLDVFHLHDVHDVLACFATMLFLFAVYVGPDWVRVARLRGLAIAILLAWLALVTVGVVCEFSAPDIWRRLLFSLIAGEATAILAGIGYGFAYACPPATTPLGEWRRRGEIAAGLSMMLVGIWGLVSVNRTIDLPTETAGELLTRAILFALVFGGIWTFVTRSTVSMALLASLGFAAAMFWWQQQFDPSTPPFLAIAGYAAAFNLFFWMTIVVRIELPWIGRGHREFPPQKLHSTVAK